MFVPISEEQREAINQTLGTIIGQQTNHATSVCDEEKENDVEQSSSSLRINMEDHRKHRNKSFPDEVNYAALGSDFNAWVKNLASFGEDDHTENIADEIRSLVKDKFSMFGDRRERLPRTSRGMSHSGHRDTTPLDKSCHVTSAQKGSTSIPDRFRLPPSATKLKVKEETTTDVPMDSTNEQYQEIPAVNDQRPPMIVQIKSRAQTTIENQLAQTNDRPAFSYPTESIILEQKHEEVTRGTDILDYLDRVQKMTTCETLEPINDQFMDENDCDWLDNNRQEETNFGLVKPTFSTPSPPANFYQRLRMF